MHRERPSLSRLERRRFGLKAPDSDSVSATPSALVSGSAAVGGRGSKTCGGPEAWRPRDLETWRPRGPEAWRPGGPHSALRVWAGEAAAFLLGPGSHLGRLGGKQGSRQAPQLRAPVPAPRERLPAACSARTGGQTVRVNEERGPFCTGTASVPRPPPLLT